MFHESATHYPAKFVVISTAFACGYHEVFHQSTPVNFYGTWGSFLSAGERLAMRCHEVTVISVVTTGLGGTSAQTHSMCPFYAPASC